MNAWEKRKRHSPHLQHPYFFILSPFLVIFSQITYNFIIISWEINQCVWIKRDCTKVSQFLMAWCTLECIFGVNWHTDYQIYWFFRLYNPSYTPPFSFADSVQTEYCSTFLLSVCMSVTGVTFHISHIYKGINAMLNHQTLYILNQNHPGYLSSKDQTRQDHLLCPDQPDRWLWL